MFQFKDHSMIETHCLKNVVFFQQQQQQKEIRN